MIILIILLKKLNLIFFKYNSSYLLKGLDINHTNNINFNTILYFKFIPFFNFKLYIYIIKNLVYLKKCKNNIIFIYDDYILIYDIKNKFLQKYKFKFQVKTFLKSLFINFNKFIIINFSNQTNKLVNLLVTTQNIPINIPTSMKNKNKIENFKVNQKFSIICLFYILTN